jgi:signal transduction histidine kinase/ActR/RegA family two-component response regulator
MISDPIFSSAFHSSPIGQYLLAPTDRLEILAVNDAFLRSVSRRREEVLGMPLFEAFAGDPTDPGDTGIHALASSIRTAVETGQSQRMPVQRYPIKMQKDGRTWFEDMYWSATNTPVLDADGALACISHTTIDITAQVRAEQALRLSREEALRNLRRAEAEQSSLAAVLQAAPVGVLVVDRDLTVLHRNPAHKAMFGAATHDELQRIDFDDWTGWFTDGPQAGRQLTSEEWPLRRAAGGTTVEQCLLRVQSFGGDQAERMLLVSAAPIVDGGGMLVGAVSVTMDIEARVRAEEALRESNQRKDEFLAMLGHELRNPLAPISAAASLLALDSANVDHVRRSSAVITRQVQHMTSLIDELLDVARVTRGLITLDRSILDAKRIVAEALEQMRPTIEARRHTLRIHQPPMPAFVDADRKRLVQVLANLLNNAAKFTPEGGVIAVELAIDAHHVRMSVEDNGIGMSPELIDHAFELFTQAERTSDRAQGGLGIGLALVRSLVTLHGGHVSANSGGSGKGTRFTICLPRVDAAADATGGAARPASRGDGASPASADSLKVLVVDDNEDGLNMLEMLLASMGHRVVTTTHPREVVALARAERPDVCLLDIGLPDIDGLMLARMLRDDPVTRDATLLAMSGYGQEADKAAAREAGFERYFVKPLHPDALAEALAALARARSTPDSA